MGKPGRVTRLDGTEIEVLDREEFFADNPGTEATTAAADAQEAYLDELLRDCLEKMVLIERIKERMAQKEAERVAAATLPHPACVGGRVVATCGGCAGSGR